MLAREILSKSTPIQHLENYNPSWLLWLPHGLSGNLLRSIDKTSSHISPSQMFLLDHPLKSSKKEDLEEEYRDISSGLEFDVAKSKPKFDLVRASFDHGATKYESESGNGDDFIPLSQSSQMLVSSSVKQKNADPLISLNKVQSQFSKLERLVIVDEKVSFPEWSNKQVVNWSQEGSRNTEPNDDSIVNGSRKAQIFDLLSGFFQNTESTRAYAVITSPKYLPRTILELSDKDKIPRKLAKNANLVRKGFSIKIFDCFEKQELNMLKLFYLLERSFGNSLNRGEYVSRFSDPFSTSSISKIFIAGKYEGVSIMTREFGQAYYLDKFAVLPESRGNGMVEILWQEMTANYPMFYWRSRRNNPVNSWYLERCTGFKPSSEWIVFWFSASKQLPAGHDMNVRNIANNIKKTFN